MSDDPFYDFFLLCLKNNEEKVFSFLEEENLKLNTSVVCSLIRGGTNINILSRVIEEENSQFFETSVISNRIDVFQFLRQRYPNFDLKGIIRQLFFHAFVENENWEMTKILEDCGFPLVNNLVATFIMCDGGDKFKRYCLYQNYT